MYSIFKSPYFDVNTLLKTTLFVALALVVQYLTIGFSYASNVSAPVASAIQIADKYGSETRYTILRNGKRIGEHTVIFEQLEDSLTVSVESNIKVTVLKIPVFRFHYTATEVWHDNQLQSVTAVTTEGGQSVTISYDKSTTAKIVAYASNHWHPGVLKSQQVFNTITGNLSQISLTKQGNEELDTQSSRTAASHYRYAGDIEADVWYDDRGLWVKLQFMGEDGSVITYIRE